VSLCTATLENHQHYRCQMNTKCDCQSRKIQFDPTDLMSLTSVTTTTGKWGTMCVQLLYIFLFKSFIRNSHRINTIGDVRKTVFTLKHVFLMLFLVLYPTETLNATIYRMSISTKFKHFEKKNEPHRRAVNNILKKHHFCRLEE